MTGVHDSGGGGVGAAMQSLAVPATSQCMTVCAWNEVTGAPRGLHLLLLLGAAAMPSEADRHRINSSSSSSSSSSIGGPRPPAAQTHASTRTCGSLALTQLLVSPAGSKAVHLRLARLDTILMSLKRCETLVLSRPRGLCVAGCRKGHMWGAVLPGRPSEVAPPPRQTLLLLLPS